VATDKRLFLLRTVHPSYAVHHLQWNDIMVSGSLLSVVWFLDSITKYRPHTWWEAHGVDTFTAMETSDLKHLGNFATEYWLLCALHVMRLI
jgi:hypothetical protein